MSLTLTILSFEPTAEGTGHALVSVTDGTETYVVGVGNVPAEGAQADIDSRAEYIWQVAQLNGATGDDATRMIEEQASRGIIRDMYVQVVSDFTAALANWDVLTVGQQKAVLKRVVQVQLYLLRFIRKEFDY
jgi:hypothetical protein